MTHARSSLHALDAPPPAPLLQPVAGQIRPRRLPSRPRADLLRRPPCLVAALLPRARLCETLALTAWVAGAAPAPPCHRLIIEDDRDLFITSHDLYNDLPVSLMMRCCYAALCLLRILYITTRRVIQRQGARRGGEGRRERLHKDSEETQT